MAHSVPYSMTSGSINLLLDNRPRTIDVTHINYRAVRDWLRTGSDTSLDGLRDLVDIPRFIATLTHGRVEVGPSEVRFDGEQMAGVLVDRMLEMLAGGFDIQPMACFMNNVMNNPLKTAQDELFLWLEESGMPLTPDGHFLAYKKVNDTFESYWTGTDAPRVMNRIGDTVEMDRLDVDPDREATCSAGLHFCSWSYLPHYYGSRGRVVVLKINPADVVAIPSDYNNAKGRAWKYLVVGEVPEDDAKMAFTEPVVTGFGDFNWTDDDDDFDNPCREIDDTDGAHNWEDDYPDDFDDDYDNIENRDYFQNSEVQKADMYHYGDKSWTGSAIEELVKLEGQRGVTRLTGIPRTTLQGWLKKIRNG